MTGILLNQFIMDIAGVRVVCPFISDVYHIAGLLLKQGDIKKCGNTAENDCDGVLGEFGTSASI